MPYTSNGSYIRNPAAYAAASGGAGMYTSSGSSIRNSSAYLAACESSGYSYSTSSSYSSGGDSVSRAANDYGYTEISTKQPAMRSFTRETKSGKERVNYYESTGTIGTSLNHLSIR